jgi:hypothetical protein
VDAPTLPGLPETVAGNPADEAALLSEQYRLIFEDSEQAAGWLEDYFELVEEGWSWRQAVYMIWASQPKPRTPATELELARQVLGLSSARAIRHWKADNPGMELRIRKLQLGALGKARAEVLEALVDSATTPSYRNYRDRELFLKMTGDYVPRERVDVGTAAPESDLAALSAEELAALAEIPVDHEADGAEAPTTNRDGAE